MRRSSLSFSSNSTGIPDGDLYAFKAHFSDKEIAKFTAAIGTIKHQEPPCRRVTVPASGLLRVRSRVKTVHTDWRILGPAGPRSTSHQLQSCRRSSKPSVSVLLAKFLTSLQLRTRLQPLRSGWPLFQKTRRSRGRRNARHHPGESGLTSCPSAIQQAGLPAPFAGRLAMSPLPRILATLICRQTEQGVSDGPSYSDCLHQTKV